MAAPNADITTKVEQLVTLHMQVTNSFLFGCWEVCKKRNTPFMAQHLNFIHNNPDMC